MFHSRNGLFFHATGQGNVRIIKTSDGKEPVSCLAADPDRVETNIVCDVTLPENEWASVVCSVSKDGETASRWDQARRFHGNEIPFPAAILTPAAPEEKLTAEDEEWMNAPMGTPKGKLNAVATVAPIKTEPDTTNFPKLVHKKGYPDWLFLAVHTPRYSNGKEVTVYRMSAGFGTVAVYTFIDRLFEDYVEVAPKQRATFTVET